MKFALALAALLVSATAASNVARADGLPPGSYQQSCSEIRATQDLLSASCRTRSGEWGYTSLRDYQDCEGDIANDDGRLGCAEVSRDERTGDNNAGYYDSWLPVGSYRSSCRNITRSDSTLIAECRDNYGRFRYTELAGYRACDGDIQNYNGILRCAHDEGIADGGRETGGDVNNGLPGGPWRSTCQNGKVEREMLFATCRDFDGNWRQATLSLRSCGGDVINENGTLACRQKKPEVREERVTREVRREREDRGRRRTPARITLFRDTNHSGPSHSFTRGADDLGAFKFRKVASSAVVQGGVWQLCDRPNYSGNCVVLDRSTTNLKVFGFNDRVVSVRRIQ